MGAQDLTEKRKGRQKPTKPKQKPAARGRKKAPELRLTTLEGKPLRPHQERPDYVHMDDLGDVMNLTSRRLRQLEKDGSLPKIVDGFMPFTETVNRYCKYSQERSRGRPASAKSEEADAIQRERHRKLRLENDFKEGKLVEFELVAQLMAEAVVMLRNQLDGAAGRIAGGDAVLRQRLLREHRRIQEAIADGFEGVAARFAVSETDEAGAAEGSVAVGGSEKGTTEG